MLWWIRTCASSVELRSMSEMSACTSSNSTKFHLLTGNKLLRLLKINLLRWAAILTPNSHSHLHSCSNQQRPHHWFTHPLTHPTNSTTTQLLPPTIRDSTPTNNNNTLSNNHSGISTTSTTSTTSSSSTPTQVRDKVDWRRTKVSSKSAAPKEINSFTTQL